MNAMIPIEQVEQMIAAGVAEAVTLVQAQFQREIDRLMAELTAAQRTMAERIVPLQEALAQAKLVIAKLQTQLYGTRAETSQGAGLPPKGHSPTKSLHFQ